MIRTIARPLPRTVPAAAVDPAPGRAAVLSGVAAALLLALFLLPFAPARAQAPAPAQAPVSSMEPVPG